MIESITSMGPTVQTKWTTEETDWLIENHNMMGSQALADHLGRSVKSVQRKCEQLHISIWRSELFGDGLRDLQGRVQIGNRILLAKTCPKCGRFLMSRRFFRRKSGNRTGHWYVACIGCTGQENNQRERDHHSNDARNQWSSLKNAENNGKDWTQEEDDVIRDPDNSLMEAATIIGRTYYATCERAHRIGVHKSVIADVGKYWVIR